LSVAKLISQRFGGRKGNYEREHRHNNPAPRNSDKRSIGRDCSLVTIFTSNYPLAEESKTALQKLELYQSLLPTEVSAITGSDRSRFAKYYLRQCLVDTFDGSCYEISTENISLDLLCSGGDTRPLVRQLRMYAYYLGKLLTNNAAAKTDEKAVVKAIEVSQGQTKCTLIVEIEADGEPNRRAEQHLKLGTLSNWYPTGSFVFDSRIELAIEKLKGTIGEEKIAELAVVLEFWFSATLAPAVILSRDENVVRLLMDAIGCMGNDLRCIRNVDTQTRKMIRSLYDPKETPNLRDDILKFGRGTFVATELRCPSEDSQLCIREMIEDSPSMTAFSSTKSALYKSGLLFAIYVEGGITPEVLSRVSIVL